MFEKIKKILLKKCEFRNICKNYTVASKYCTGEYERTGICGGCGRYKNYIRKKNNN